jgi:hypothetical protein
MFSAEPIASNADATEEGHTWFATTSENNTFNFITVIEIKL